MNKPFQIVPKCEFDREKCKAFIRIYKRNEPKLTVSIERDQIRIDNSDHAYFVEEVNASVSEKYQGDYRLKFNSKSIGFFDNWFPDNQPLVQHSVHYLVLRFEVENGFESSCI
jgi:hypothetical protein